MNGSAARWMLRRLPRALAARGRVWLGHVDPRRIGRRRAHRTERAHVEELLLRFSSEVETPFPGSVLVDGTWDNPNHWVRYALVRRALGLAGAREIGLVGPHRVRECTETFRRLGVRDVVRFDELPAEPQRCQQDARALLAATRAPHDLLSWRLPHDFPPGFFYDGLLKRQRTACVDLGDPRLPAHVAEGLASLRAAERLVTEREWRLVMLSHAVNFQYGALAWMAIQRGIPVVVLYGEFGVCRLVKLTRPDDLQVATNRPARRDIDALPAERAARLEATGSAYLEKRRAGGTRELAAILAYQRRRETVDRYAICERFRWDPARPIVAVYAANWFDLPHMYGMSHFRDFLDWLEATVSAAVRNRSVSWLFKAHPCDEWYGGVTLRDLMPSTSPPHVRLVPDTWGSSVMDAVDGLVTYHGTAGIEFAATGKPVLLADQGWYHDLGVARWPRSRGEYLEELGREWWKDVDLADTARRARILAGWHFCRPAWQGEFVLDDDPVQERIYGRIPDLWARNGDSITREVRMIREWFASSDLHYHTYKMGRTDAFAF